MRFVYYKGILRWRKYETRKPFFICNIRFASPFRLQYGQCGDDTVHYDIYVFDISAEPYDDIDRKYNARYLAEANAIERLK